MDNNIDTHRNVSIIKTIEEIYKIKKCWEQYATYPESDYEMFVESIKASNNKVKPCVFVYTKNGSYNGLLIGKIIEQELQFKIGYIPVIKKNAKVLSIVDRGFVGDISENAAKYYLSYIKNVLLKNKISYVHMASLELESPLRLEAKNVFSKYLIDYVNVLEQRWHLELPDSYEIFLSSRSKKTRYNIKKNTGYLLESKHSIKVVACMPGDIQINKLFNDIKTIHKYTYQAKHGLTNLDNDDADKMWSCMVDNKRVIACVVYINDKPAAFSYAHVYKQHATLKTPGYIPEYKDLHVGEYSLLNLIKCLIENKVCRYLDYGLGYAQYKETLGTRFCMSGHVRIYSKTFHGMQLLFIRNSTTVVSVIAKKVLNYLGIKNVFKKRMRK